ncbi:MAG TPA: hypothetical protein VEK08_02310 [Planctomycetota bacterium]|nr:hypothetical protein [Planctomycetota bacterium]
MGGMAYATFEEEPQPAPLRLLGVCALAAAIHLVPMLYLTLPPARLLDENLTYVALDVDDAALAAAPFPSEQPRTEQPKVSEAAPTPEVKAALKEKKAPPPELLPEQPKSAAPKTVAAPKPIEAPPEKPLPAQPAPEQRDEKKVALHEPNLPPLNPKDLAAFDESKTTKEMPKEGYASDRNSTAADRGPKNLPRGDAYIDKGQSTSIRYLEKRGEGNLPALPSSDTAGSVKKEGNPDAGRGLPDEILPEKKMPPKSRVLPDEVKPDQKPQEKKVTEKPAQPQLKEIQTLPAAATAAAQEEKGDTKKLGFEKSETGTQPLATTPTPKAPQPEVAETNAPVKKEAPPVPTLTPETVEIAAAESPRRDKAADELAAFRALLDGKGKTPGKGGNAGEKAGMLSRPGAKGHEGDGSVRPGHDDAVSDVTTINLISSAEEFDEARFAKRLDPKAAYVKPLARRIDAKWKAELIVRNRFRAVRGIVAIKIVMRKDGKLLEASEVPPRLAGMPDEYVAVAKLAVHQASEPLSEPFPPELGNRETIEFIFSFQY